jgi:hypothetical protein
LLLLLLAQIAQSQSHTHQIACPDGPSKDACGLFNEAADDDDKDLYDPTRRDHMLVCFRPNSNVFFVLSYDSPRENLWQEKDAGNFQQSGNVNFLKFTNGRVSSHGESMLAVGWWVSKSRIGAGEFQGTSLLPGDKGRIEVDPSRIQVFHPFIQTFDNMNFSKTEYDFVLTNSTSKFVETLRPPGGTSAPAPVEGRCITYK